MSKSVALLVGLTFSFSTFAASHMLVLGGGGEPAKDETIFDYELSNAADFVQRSRWDVRISFNGGHSKTEQIAQRIAGKSNTRNSHFTAASYEAMIADYERKILSGQIKTGDQLLLMISSHGSQKIPGEKTHQISATSLNQTGITDYNTLQGGVTVSLDRLEKLTKLAEEKGIKLGILDFSCHSGLTQKLANKNTCVISSTGPEHFAWGGTNFTFAAKFTEHMRSGKSLEDVFLDAIKTKKETSFPMISSSIGNEIQETMYPLISPYLHDTRSDLTKSKMKQFYTERYAKDRCENLNNDYNELINFTYDIENIVDQANYSKLRNLLAQYNGLQQGIIQNTKLLNSTVNLNRKKEYCDQSGAIRICMNYTPMEILNLDIDQMENLLIRQSQSASKSRQSSIDSNLRIYQQLKREKNQLLQDQKIKTANRFWDQSQVLSNTEKLANDIATEAQTAFYNTYQTLRKEEGSKGPCAEIKL